MTKTDLKKIKSLRTGKSMGIKLTCGNQLTITRYLSGYQIQSLDESPFALTWDRGPGMEKPIFWHDSLVMYIDDKSLPVLAHLMKALAQRHKIKEGQ